MQLVTTVQWVSYKAASGFVTMSLCFFVVTEIHVRHFGGITTGLQMRIFGETFLRPGAYSCDGDKSTAFGGLDRRFRTMGMVDPSSISVSRLPGLMASTNVSQ